MSTFLGSRSGNETLAIATGYGILDRDFRRELGMKVPRYNALSIMRELSGRLAPQEKVKNQEYYYWEEGDWFPAAFTIAAVDNSTPGQTTITLSTADHVDSGTRSFPLVTDEVVFEDETVGLITAKNTSSANAHTVTIKNQNSDQNVQTAAVIGTTVVAYGNAQSEASDTPATRIPVVSKVTNYIHTNRAAYKFSDFAAQNQTEFEYNGQKYLYAKGLDELEEQFSMKEELNMIITPAAASLTDASSNSIRSVNGLIPQIRSNGQNVEYFDEPDLAFFEDTVLTMDDNYGDDEYFVGQGKNFSLGTVNWLSDFFNGGDNRISFNAFDGGATQAASFDFRSIHIGGVTFHFQTWNILSHRGSLGAGNMPYRHMAIMIPAGTGKDEARSSVPKLRIRYSEPQGAPHEIQGDVKIFSHGGASRRGATNGVQQEIFEMISYKSLEVRNREQFVIARKGNI